MCCTFPTGSRACPTGRVAGLAAAALVFALCGGWRRTEATGFTISDAAGLAGPNLSDAAGLAGPNLSDAASVEPASAAMPCPLLNGHPLGCPAVGARKAVMLAVAGLRHRMLFETTPTAVIQSLAKDGFAVHVYINLVEKVETATWRPERKYGQELPQVKNLSPSQLREYYSNVIQDHGGCLICFHVGPRESLPPIPDGPVIRKRMMSYSPLQHEVGRNVLRLWQARQRLWGYAQQVEEKLSMNYSLAMWARDDTRWLGRLRDMRPLLDLPDGCARCLFSKGCKEWGGINDKVVLLGREASPVMFGAYDAFMSPVGPELTSDNSEQFLQALGRKSGVRLYKIFSQEVAPSGDAMYLGEEDAFGSGLLSFLPLRWHRKRGRYCFMRGYWCGSFEDVSKAGASFCEDITENLTPTRPRILRDLGTQRSQQNT